MYVLKMPSILLLLVILSTLSLTHSFAMTMATSLDLSSLFTPKSKISGPSVVVLGGNGFVGSRVCKYLVVSASRLLLTSDFVREFVLGQCCLVKGTVNS
jgi:hypothetical protein